MDRDVEEPALSGGVDLGNPLDGRARPVLGVDEREPTGAFGDQQPPVVREERESPWVLEPVRNTLHGIPDVFVVDRSAAAETAGKRERREATGGSEHGASIGGGMCDVTRHGRECLYVEIGREADDASGD